MSGADRPAAHGAGSECAARTGDNSSQANPFTNVATLLLYCPVADFVYLLAISPALAGLQERGLSIGWSRTILLATLAFYALVIPVALCRVLGSARHLIRKFVSGLFLGFLASLVALFVYAQYIIASGRAKTTLFIWVCLLSSAGLALLWSGPVIAWRDYRRGRRPVAEASWE